MRILPIAKQWEKLEKPEWTTFRLCRRDRDWQVGEVVQVVLHSRSKKRVVLGVAQIVDKEARQLPGSGLYFPTITSAEAIADGFTSLSEMEDFMWQKHGQRAYDERLNKLTLEWLQQA